MPKNCVFVYLFSDIQDEIVGDVQDLFALVIDYMARSVDNPTMHEGLRILWIDL